MQEEALPVVKALGLGAHLADGKPLEPPLPGLYFSGNYKGLQLMLTVNGQDRAHGVSAVGTLAAGLTTHAALKRFDADLVLSTGTAGGFHNAGSGVSLGDVVLASHTVYHDRRISPPHP